jgi:uncharacterized protein YecE (DUF72 family)
VELNGTFYRTPTLNSLKKYAAETPDGFLFSVKMSKYITHILKMKESSPSIHAFQDLVQDGLRDKLSCFLFQLPASFRYSEENLEHLLENIPHEARNVVELRHISWWNATVEASFKSAGITFCNVDYPGLTSYFIHTSRIFYLRLHGNPDLFKSAYNRHELEGFYARYPARSIRYHTYFNNTYYEAGYQNALQMMEIMQLKKTPVGK